MSKHHHLTGKKLKATRAERTRKWLSIFADGKQKAHRAFSLYLIACIWMLVAVANFLLNYTSVAALFAAIGIFTLLFAFYADWKESRRK